MEPSIQYARSVDGVSIAYWTHGDGYPLVQTPSSNISPSRRAWQFEVGRRWYDGLARGRRLVRYDNRGCGESQRGITDFPPDFEVEDLETVVDHLGLERFALLAYIFSGPAAITYAARHLERVSHLILWCTGARESNFDESPALEALRSADYDLYLQTLALTTFGWSEQEQGAQYARALRESASPESMEVLSGLPRRDATDLLPSITAPALVLHRRGLRAPSPNVPRELAAALPNGRLAIFEGDSAVPYVGDMAPVLEAIDEFLRTPAPAAAQAPATAGGFSTVLFTDLEGSTSLTQRLGDAAAQELLREHNASVRAGLAAHGGREIKHTGDGIMASFGSASRAVESAIAIQRALGVHNETAATPVRVRIGLNAGEPVDEDGDLFGTMVQLARRVCDAGDAGEIIVTNVVRELCAGKNFLFADRGVSPLKGFEDPVRLYEVRWRE